MSKAYLEETEIAEENKGPTSVSDPDYDPDKIICKVKKSTRDADWARQRLQDGGAMEPQRRQFHARHEYLVKRRIKTS